MDKEEYDKLFVENMNDFYKHAINRSSGGDIMADDVMQDAYIKGLGAVTKNNYVEQGKFNSWMKLLISNLIIDKYRAITKRGKFINFDSDVFDIMDMLISEDNVEKDMIVEESLTRIKEMLSIIPEVQKEVVMLRESGMAFKDIADLTGVSINTAIGRSRYARLNIIKLL